MVASYIDAWIEIIFQGEGNFNGVYVASYIDAWIEIELEGLTWKDIDVASYIDAWIEIETS